MHRSERSAAPPPPHHHHPTLTPSLASACGQGYYTPCTSDYWYHGAPGGGLAKSKCGGVDFHDSVLEEIKPAAMSGPGSLNGTCASRGRSATASFISSLTTGALLSADDQVVFSQRAVELIHAHDQSRGPFYCYLAYHNVHDACTADRFAGGLDAPMGTVDLCERMDITEVRIWLSCRSQ